MIIGNLIGGMKTYLDRRLQLAPLLERKSFFLFGPRSTGKSTLLRHEFRSGRVYDLLDQDVFSRLTRRPALLGEEGNLDDLVIIDEIQKLPMLLDEVHRLIERHDTRFLMTGSSARKLRRGSVNLLAGRAWTAELFPLTCGEIPEFDLATYLNRGGLPHIYPSPDFAEELRAYTSTYLREEIAAEALARRIDAFARVLALVALTNGREINLQSLASDCGVAPRTLRNYLDVLIDTLLAFEVPPFKATRRRKAISRSKLYLFDVGVVNSLARRGEIQPGSELFGVAFEHFIVLEVRAFLSCLRRSEPLQYWRSTSGFEVDIVIGDRIAVEIKSSDLVSERDLKGLRALREEGLIEQYCVVSRDPNPRILDGIAVLPWAEFLSRLWNGELV